MQRAANQKIVFVTGAAYGGKSAFVQNALADLDDVVFVGTAHKPPKKGFHPAVSTLIENRPKSWRVLENFKTLDDLKATVEKQSPKAVIFDCVNLWLGQVLTENYQKYSPEQLVAHAEHEMRYLLNTLEGFGCPVVVISSEVGGGVVPSAPSGRAFREILGRANQSFAQSASFVCLLVAGVALVIKDKSQPQQELTPVQRAGAQWFAHRVLI